MVRRHDGAQGRLSGDAAERVEAPYQGDYLDDDRRDHDPENKATARPAPRLEPTFGLAIGDAQHRGFVANLYADTRG